MAGQIYQIQQLDFSAVGAAPLEAELTPVPFRGKIARVRAIVTGGTAINQVAYEIRLVTGGTNLEIIAASNGLVAQPIDEVLSEHYFEVANSQEGVFGTLFVAVAVDDATTDHTIEFQVTFENLV